MRATIMIGWRGCLALISALALTARFEAAAAADTACLERAETAQVAAVEDVRAIRLVDGRLLRAAGIESFALLHADAAAADAALLGRMQSLLAGNSLRIRLLSDETDRYGRLPALLAANGAPLLQTILVGEGLALAFATDKTVPCFAAILAAEDEARRKGRGFWTEARVLRARPEALAPRTGRFAIFEGEVLSVGNRPGRSYLNFGYRWSSDVTVEISSRQREALGGEATLATLAGKRLRVRGFVEERAGPVVTVSSPMQIEVLGDAPAILRNRP